MWSTGCIVFGKSDDVVAVNGLIPAEHSLIWADGYLPLQTTTIIMMIISLLSLTKVVGTLITLEMVLMEVIMNYLKLNL